jgi:SAM-dependent methyltransferase
MHNHFEEYLHIRSLLEEERPSRLLELGAANGENTQKLLSVCEEIEFDIVVVSPERPTSWYMDDVGVVSAKRLRFDHARLEWVYGISYIELPRMGSGSIDFCIVDTDHNYWTLRRELSELDRVMRDGGVVVIHDTVSFAHHNAILELGYYKTIDNITMASGGDDVLYIRKADTTSFEVPYPLAEIKEEGRPFPQAIVDTVPHWEVIRESMESGGAVALRKGVRE